MDDENRGREGKPGKQGGPPSPHDPTAAVVTAQVRVAHDDAGVFMDTVLDQPAAPSSGRSKKLKPAGTTIKLDVISHDHYEILWEMARGGIGRILRAKDRRLDRMVALKELHIKDPEFEARFIREIQITARLQHPNIIPLYEAGRWPEGDLFYAMKLVDGKSLADAMRECVDLNQRLALVPTVLDVADAMAYAHSQHIIHRDLKPSNVLVGPFGETVVIDWGIAKQLEIAGQEGAVQFQEDATGEIFETAMGVAVGTPSAMPPEQALGAPVYETADVYSLGALLYFVIAGHMPYSDRSHDNILESVRAGPPTSLLKLVPEAPPELLAIVERAMERYPSRRYRTAKEMSDDLKRYVTCGFVGATP